LAVAGGDEVVPIINQLKSKLPWDLVVLSQDWHPKGHHSFSSVHVGEKDVNGNAIKSGTVCFRGGEVLWPDHCVQGSKGSEFHPNLRVEKTDKIVQKGKNPQVDSYSAFVDNNKKQMTGLYDILDHAGITTVYICGIATDYCVNYTCQDAVERKDGKKPAYKTHLILDAARGVDNTTSVAAVEDLKKKGVVVVQSQDLLKDGAKI